MYRHVAYVDSVQSGLSFDQLHFKCITLLGPNLYINAVKGDAFPSSVYLLSLSKIQADKVSSLGVYKLKIL